MIVRRRNVLAILGLVASDSTYYGKDRKPKEPTDTEPGSALSSLLDSTRQLD